MKMDILIENYKSKLLSKKLSTNTVNSYIYDIKSFGLYIEKEYAQIYTQAKKTQILTYLVELQKEGKSSSTIARNISSLKGFYEYLREEKIITDNPLYNIHSPKHVSKIPVYLNEKEITELMQLPQKSTFKGSRDSALLELLYSSGIKVSELINIKISDIIFNASIIRISGSVDRMVPIGSIALNSIINYIENFRDNKVKENTNEFLFVNRVGEELTRQGVWKILKYYEKKLKINKELSPQVLRNSFAIHLLNHGADIGAVQELLGQKNITAMQNYLQASEQNSLQIFKNTHPRA